MELKNVFIYHLDNELQKLFLLNKYDYCSVYTIFNLSTKMAYLICKDKILIPASNYFESDLSFKIINDLKELNEIGIINLISSSHNIDELIKKKNDQHENNLSIHQYHYNDFLNTEKKIILPGTLIRRERSASKDIEQGWYSAIINSNLKDQLTKYLSDTVKVTTFEDILFGIPKRLGNKAYISEYIMPMLPIAKEKKQSADYIINGFITREYISSFLKEYNAVCLKDIPIIDSDLILPSENDYRFSYVSYSKIASRLKIIRYKGKDAFQFLIDCNAYELIEFKYSSIWQDILMEIMNSDRIVHPFDSNRYDERKKFIVTTHIKGDLDMKKPMLFISHATADINYVQLIVELFADIGLSNNTMFCSSVPDYHIPMDNDIYDYLKGLFENYELHVIFVLSENYYESAACLNEMGASWVLKKRYSTILLPKFDFSAIKGAVNPSQISLKLDNDNDAEIKVRLGELKDIISDEFGLSVPANRWEKKRDAFIEELHKIIDGKI